jgi:outer membrane receptor protein involved in Fe transport
VWSHAGDARTSAGADLRRVRGETREYFTFAAGDFTRQRIAGGTQDFAGGLFRCTSSRSPRTCAPRSAAGSTAGAKQRRPPPRDRPRHRRGAARRSLCRPRRLEFSPSAGLVWQAGAGVARARRASSRRSAGRRSTSSTGRSASAMSSPRPTPRCAPSGSPSAELGADSHAGPLTLGATLFWNELHDAVGNVTIAHGPGTFPIVGFVPAGGLGRQRLNLDRIRVRGLELSATWRPAAAFSVNAAFLYNDATVQSAAVAPALAASASRRCRG